MGLVSASWVYAFGRIGNANDEAVSEMNLDKYDVITRREIEVFLERKDAEHDKLKGQIAKDLRRVGGEDGFIVAGNYRKLEEKYRRWHVSRKKLAILDKMKKEWCRDVG